MLMAFISYNNTTEFNTIQILHPDWKEKIIILIKIIKSKFQNNHKFNFNIYHKPSTSKLSIHFIIFIPQHTNGQICIFC